jgi:hypothetical protein
VRARLWFAAWVGLFAIFLEQLLSFSSLPFALNLLSLKIVKCCFVSLLIVNAYFINAIPVFTQIGDRLPLLIRVHHGVELPLHRNLLSPQETSGRGGDNYRRYIEPKPSTLPRIATISIGILLLSVSLQLIVYSLKRSDYFLVIGLLLMFPILSLGIELLTFNACPPYLVSFYSSLPICRYEPSPHGFPQWPSL